MGRHSHWQNVYRHKDHTRVSWFQDNCAEVLKEIGQLKLSKDASIIDIGGGASRLVDNLLDAGYTRLTVLDIAQQSLDIAQLRLAEKAAKVNWICADITQGELPGQYDLWYDRAAFHFLTEAEDQRAYVAKLQSNLKPGALVMIATFAKGGPERCSDLIVEQYDEAKMLQILGPTFELLKSYQSLHETPRGSKQLFQHFVLRATKD